MTEARIEYDNPSNNHMVPGYVEAVFRLRSSDGRASLAFDSLDLPFGSADAAALLDNTLKALVPHGEANSKKRRERAFGAMLLLAMVAVEADRKERSGE